MRTRFLEHLYDPATFTLTLELVPSRGGRSQEHDRALSLAREIAADGRIKAVSITENAGGHAALSPEVLGVEIRDLGLEVIVHLSCKDKNRNQMASHLFAWDRLGLSDLLVITGDYPKPGYMGLPKPVFDLDSVHALDLISRMNRGEFAAHGSVSGTDIQPTRFSKGVALSPFKKLAGELLLQYAKLHRKALAGADFVITQVGFDARKFHEVLCYLSQHRLDLPVLGNVFIPTLRLAELIHAGGVPGCVIPESLIQEMRKEAQTPDRGKKARLVRSAKLLALLKGMGFAGAHLGGPGLTMEDIAFVLDQAEIFAPRWRELVGEFNHPIPDGHYLYRFDPATGLNGSEEAVPPRPRPCWRYRLARFIHDLAFAPQGLLFKPMRAFCLKLDAGRLSQPFARFEHLVKFLAFSCQNCGDCTLAEQAFVCPQNGCAKYLLNGPCGGSRDGWCEVYPGRRRCHYLAVYQRLAAEGRLESLKLGIVPPRNWSLNNTSSWANFFAGRDHTSSRNHDRQGQKKRFPPSGKPGI